MGRDTGGTGRDGSGTGTGMDDTKAERLVIGDRDPPATPRRPLPARTFTRFRVNTGRLMEAERVVGTERGAKQARDMQAVEG